MPASSAPTRLYILPDNGVVNPPGATIFCREKLTAVDHKLFATWPFWVPELLLVRVFNVNVSLPPALNTAVRFDGSFHKPGGVLMPANRSPGYCHIAGLPSVNDCGVSLKLTMADGPDSSVGARVMLPTSR